MQENILVCITEGMVNLQIMFNFTVQYMYLYPQMTLAVFLLNYCIKYISLMYSMYFDDVSQQKTKYLCIRFNNLPKKVEMK